MARSEQRLCWPATLLNVRVRACKPYHHRPDKVVRPFYFLLGLSVPAGKAAPALTPVLSPGEDDFDAHAAVVCSSHVKRSNFRGSRYFTRNSETRLTRIKSLPENNAYLAVVM